MIYIGADHRGFKLKEKLKEFLTARGYQMTDMGTNSEESADYPLIAQSVAEQVKNDFNNRGILLCGNAVGVCIAANKISGVRAGAAWDEKIASTARAEDNINVLCLPADYLDEEQMKKIAQTFLDMSFAGEERYKRRLKQIEEMENR